MKNLCLLIFLAIFYSCSKECTGSVGGMYSGTGTSSGTTFEGNMTIGEAPITPPGLWIQDGVFSFTGFFAHSSCQTITIDSQPAIDINGASFTVSGTLYLDGNTLTGVLTYDNGGTEVVCSYNLVRG